MRYKFSKYLLGFLDVFRTGLGVESMTFCWVFRRRRGVNEIMLGEVKLK